MDTAQYYYNMNLIKQNLGYDIVLKKIGLFFLIAIATCGILVAIGLYLNPFLGWLFNAYDTICVILETMTLLSFLLLIWVCSPMGKRLKRRNVVGAILFGIVFACGANTVLYDQYSHLFYNSKYFRVHAERYGDCTLIGETIIPDDSPYSPSYWIGYWAARTPFGKKLTIDEKNGKTYTMGNLFPAYDIENGIKLLVAFNYVEDEKHDEYGFHLDIYDTKGNLLFILPEDQIEWRPYFLPKFYESDAAFTSFFESITTLLESKGISVPPQEIERLRPRFLHGEDFGPLSCL